MFLELPHSVCLIDQLKTLDLGGNVKLAALSSNLTLLKSLSSLNLLKCPALISPPLEVCQQGLSAIIQYYIDFAASSSNKLLLATVVVIGQAGAGKTSLVKTLQNENKTRVLTQRSTTSIQDGATKVFNFENVSYNGAVLKFIDLGGQEVYHVAYRLTFRQNCVLIVVVNMTQYETLSVEIGDREAVRRLYLDWMTHCYLAQPKLGPPKLVLTHKDKYDAGEFQSLRDRFITTSDEVRNAVIAEDSLLNKAMFKEVRHLATTDSPVFPSHDIYEIGNEENEFAVFDKLMASLHEDCQRHIREVPKLWDDVTEAISKQPGCHNSLPNILDALKPTHNIQYEHLAMILTYMHCCGRLLWYKNIDCLHSYIFYDIPAVTDLIKVLYDHTSEQKWKDRLQNFQPWKIGVEIDEYEALTTDFRQTGVTSQRLLEYFISVETMFKTETEVETAANILRSFRLIHGPVKRDADSCFIIPYFAEGYLEDTLLANKAIHLVTDLNFQGLALPQFLYHQMASEVLGLFPGLTSTYMVKQNGITVLHGSCAIMFLHNPKSQKATINVGCDVESVADAWTFLIDIVNTLITSILEAWEGARLTCTYFCAHCTLTGSPHPHKRVNPPWCVISREPMKLQLCDGKMPVICKQKEEIPAALQFPCEFFNLVLETCPFVG